MGTMRGVMANLVKGLLVGLAGLFVLTGLAQAYHQGQEDAVIEVVVRDGVGFPGEELEIPIGLDSMGQIVTSLRFEVYFPGGHLPGVTARTTFPVGWVVSCKEFPVGMLRCTGANVGGGILRGNPVALHFQVATTASGFLEIRIPQESLGFFFGLTRLPAKGVAGTIAISAGKYEPQCDNTGTCVFI